MRRLYGSVLDFYSGKTGYVVKTLTCVKTNRVNSIIVGKGKDAFFGKGSYVMISHSRWGMYKISIHRWNKKAELVENFELSANEHISVIISTISDLVEKL